MNEDKKVTFQLEGQHILDPERWSVIIASEDKEVPISELGFYKDYAAKNKSGWQGFRIVKVTTIMEVL